MRGYSRRENGFVIRFKNGICVDVMWSPFDVCEARERVHSIALDTHRASQATSSHSAEVAPSWGGYPFDSFKFVPADLLPVILSRLSEAVIPASEEKELTRLRLQILIENLAEEADKK